uniref:C2H2-type domain-containing protein n=1 Tax=Musca domestica TaxID=7370 RepID=A0A1I8M6C3_MUSDO
MLKNCFLPVNYNKPGQLCGEIFYQNFDEFIFNCKLCKIKIFDYFDFVKHLKNSHANELSDIRKNEGTASWKNEETEDVEYILKCNSSVSSNTADQLDALTKEFKVEQEFIIDDAYNNNEADDDDYMPDEEEERYSLHSDPEEEDEPKSIIRNTNVPKEFPCESCEKIFVTKHRLHLHMKMVHMRERPYKCDYCDKSFFENSSLQNHIGQHTGYNCPTCNKTFSTKRNLKRHTYLHIETKEFVCSVDNCGKAFSNKILLKEHGRAHKRDIFICEECGYKCRQRESLIVHKRSHTGEKPFGCELCDRRFGSKPLLKEHMATHETERNHICDVCGKSFNRPKALYHHKHLHLGIKKYVCKVCGQAYAQAAGLSAHTRKHREDAGLFPNVLSNPLNVNTIFNNM